MTVSAAKVRFQNEAVSRESQTDSFREILVVALCLKSLPCEVPSFVLRAFYYLLFAADIFPNDAVSPAVAGTEAEICIAVG